MKFKILPDLFYTLLFVLSLSGLVFSQKNTTNAPVQWENYRIEKVKVSFLMPKLPVVVNESNYCRGEERFAYGSYADGAAFVVRITRKIDVPRNCAEKKEFGESNFNERLASLKNSALALKERENGNSKEFIFEGNKQIHKLINNSKNDGWAEFTVFGADENKPEVKNFLNSLKIGKKSSGIEIGNGAERTLGDEPKTTFDGKTGNAGEMGIENEKLQKPKTVLGDGSGDSKITPKPETSSISSTSEPLRIILKPRANYTNQARIEQTQGKVVLRVIFSANGGIGAISVVSGLENGLTEQAIAAAKRLLFIPASRNGVRYSVVKPVEYTFTIY